MLSIVNLKLTLFIFICFFSYSSCWCAHQLDFTPGKWPQWNILKNKNERVKGSCEMSKVYFWDPYMLPTSRSYKYESSICWRTISSACRDNCLTHFCRWLVLVCNFHNVTNNCCYKPKPVTSKNELGNYCSCSRLMICKIDFSRRLLLYIIITNI